MAPLTPFQLAHPFAGSPSYVYVVRHFVSVIAAELYGKALLTVWISYFVWLFVARRRRGQLKEKRSPRAKTKKKKADALSQLVKMLAPAMKGERRWIGAYVASLSTRVLITVKIADLSGRLGGYMAVKQWDASECDNHPCCLRNRIVLPAEPHRGSVTDTLMVITHSVQRAGMVRPLVYGRCCDDRRHEVSRKANGDVRAARPV